MTITPNMYHVIAQRMMWDPHFINELNRDPRAAIKETLDAADIHYDDPEDLDALVAEYNTWAAAGHLDKVSKGYMKTMEPMVM